MSKEVFFTYFSKSELALIEDFVSRGLSNWMSGWLPSDEATIERIVNVSDSGSTDLSRELNSTLSGEQVILASADAQIKIVLDPAAMLARLLCTSSYQDEPICKAGEFILEKGFLGLFSEFADKPVKKYDIENSLPSNMAGLGSGWIECRILIDSIPVQLLLGRDVLASFIAAPETKHDRFDMVDRTAAISAAKVNLKAVFGNVELSLGNFSSLQKGDVLSLSVSTEAPVSLLNESNEVVCEGYLGAAENYRAVRISGRS